MKKKEGRLTIMKRQKKQTAAWRNCPGKAHGSALAAFLALILAASLLLAGCAGGGETEDTTAAAVTLPDTGATEALTTEFSAKNLLGMKDFGKEEVVFYTRNYSGEWCSDLINDQTIGEIIPDSVASRNLKIQTEYNVTLSEKKSGAQSFYKDAEKQISAGDPDFDVLYTSIRDAASLATDGFLTEFGSVPNIATDKSWWSPFLTKQMTIANKCYYVTGEITTVDDISIRAVFFNKEMLKSIDASEDLYARITNDRWTLEDFFGLVNSALIDVGDDGKIELGTDSIGLLAEGTLGYQLLMGTGEKIIGKDENDIPYVSVTDPRPVDVIDRLTSYVSGNRAVMTNDPVYKPFGEGKVLFALVTIVRENSLKSYEVDFGIVPYPKYNSDQESFHCYSDAYCPNAISFPFGISQDSLDRASFVCEALAIESVNTVTPAFYDICMKTRYAKDEKMGDMLDIIRKDYMIDLADIYLSAWGIRTPVTKAISEGSNFTSAIQTTVKSTKIKITATVKAIEAVDH
jgi:ABC-type glycerol-3-phosphate transport system substrate-binding protein